MLSIDFIVLYYSIVLILEQCINVSINHKLQVY